MPFSCFSIMYGGIGRNDSTDRFAAGLGYREPNDDLQIIHIVRMLQDSASVEVFPVRGQRVEVYAVGVLNDLFDH